MQLRSRRRADADVACCINNELCSIAVIAYHFYSLVSTF
jgi:hypothetical protein